MFSFQFKGHSRSSGLALNAVVPPVRPSVSQIAQVHRAVTRDGREVVVKVQHSNIKEIIHSVSQMLLLLPLLAVLLRLLLLLMVVVVVVVVVVVLV